MRKPLVRNLKGSPATISLMMTNTSPIHIFLPKFQWFQDLSGFTFDICWGLSVQTALVSKSQCRMGLGPAGEAVPEEFPLQLAQLGQKTWKLEGPVEKVNGSKTGRNTTALRGQSTTLDNNKGAPRQRLEEVVSDPEKNRTRDPLFILSTASGHKTPTIVTLGELWVTH